MLKWLKNLNVITKSLILILLAFAIICISLYFIVGSDVPSPITNDQWVTIISTFFAGTLGGLIALGGIWWQLNHEKEEKKNRVKKYIIYITESIFKDERTLKDFLESERLINYHTRLDGFCSEDRYKLKKIEENFIRDNIHEILSLSYAEDFIGLEKKILDYNKNAQWQWDNHERYLSLKNKIRTINDSGEVSEKNKVLLSNYYILGYYANFIFPFTLDGDNLSFKSRYTQFTAHLTKERGLIEKLNEIIATVKNEGISSEFERLEIVTNFNEEVLWHVRSKVYVLLSSISSSTDSESLVDKCIMELKQSLDWDTKFNYQALSLYKDLEKLKIELKIKE